MTTKTNNCKTNNCVVTDAHLYRDHYDIKDRERDLLKRRWSEMPVNISAIMTATEAATYLGVSRMSMHRWHDRGVLTAIVNDDNGYRHYLLSHLWVFKILFLEGDNG